MEDSHIFYGKYYNFMKDFDNYVFISTLILWKILTIMSNTHIFYVFP